MKNEILIEGQTYDKSLVDSKKYVRISGKYFWKEGEHVCKVPTESGEKYYRKNSRLIAKDIMGFLSLKKDLVKTPSGLSIGKYGKQTRPFVNNKGETQYDYTMFFCNIDGDLYHNTDPNLIKDPNTGDLIHKKYCVELDKELYGENEFASRGSVVELDGKIVRKDDVISVVTPDGKTKQACNKVRLIKVWNGKTNKEADTLRDFLSLDLALMSQIDEFSFNEKHKVRHVASCDINSIVGRFENEVYKPRTDKIRKITKADYVDESENKQDIIYPYASSLYGGKTYLKSSANTLSSIKSLTGNIGYTFGIEPETSAGLIPVKDCKELGLSIVGDRTISGPEYVTSILHGNNGIKRLHEIYDKLREHSFVDDYCSTHIHIGGIKGDPRVDTPIFNRRFSALAIMLGTQVEKELYQIVPKSRNPRNRHCKSIAEYANYSLKDAKKMVAKYVFGQGDLDADVNCNTRLGKWTEGRYKWLNLVNCNSDNSSRSSYESSGRFYTIEFRIWPGTTNVHDVYHWTLISMAFVWYVENRQSRILNGNVGLLDVVKAAFRRSPAILESVVRFISDKKSLYNRENPYSETPIDLEYRGFVSDRFESEISRQIGDPQEENLSELDRAEIDDTVEF